MEDRTQWGGPAFVVVKSHMAMEHNSAVEFDHRVLECHMPQLAEWAAAQHKDTEMARSSAGQSLGHMIHTIFWSLQ